MRWLAVLLATLLVGSTVAVPAAAAQGTTLDHEGDAVTLSAGPAQQISGQTDLAAGATVTVRATLDDASSPLLRQKTATVGEDGNFAVTVDLHRADPGATGNVTVLSDGQRLARTPLAITACDGDCEPVATETASADSPFDFDGEAITLSAGPAQRVTGQADVTAGTEVTIRLRSTSSESPFLRRGTTTAGENGHFAVPFDLTAVEAGTEAMATLRIDGETVAERPVIIESCDDACRSRTPIETEEGDDSDGGSVDAVDSETAGPALESSLLQVHNGDATAFDISYGNADAATLSIHSEGVDGKPTWEVVATVRDSDGDGTATVRFDTGAVGSDTPTLHSPDDELTITSESTLDDGALDPADYDLTLDNGTTIDDEPSDIGTVVLLSGDGAGSTTDATATADEQSDDTATATDRPSSDTATATDQSSSDTATAPPTGDSDGMQDAGLVGGGVVGLLALFGVGSRLLN